ncbi:hypothetical protein BJY24_006420 [Nocardia transvalensis]|uniref:SMODS and SLOG-associating 2TM effector domain-containing protein n=1 Tax=Nocardia transvalensis TaxID=37333 RepID=A0A7W9ULF5_9NOCA|nr:hypothetical protein [Nocardia transvalensis]MBB5917508.1 hypothetical protein [Nocardia transvalensis]
MTDYYAVAAVRERECRVQARAYAIWLSALRPANIVLVVGAAVLSAVAGAAVLADLAGPLPGYLALVSAVFTVIHNRLDCDVHQAECRRLRAAYEAQAYPRPRLSTRHYARRILCPRYVRALTDRIKE